MTDPVIIITVTGSGSGICLLLFKVLHSVGKVLATVRAIERKWDSYAVEHELLIVDYCERKNISLSDLPTRTGGLDHGRN